MWTPKLSSTSAGVIWLDLDKRVAEVRQAVARASQRLPLRRAVLFGSLAQGAATPRSDADLLLVIADSRYPRPRDRVPEAIEALRPLPCPMDLLVITEEEERRALEQGSSFLEGIRRTGIEVWPDPLPPHA